MSAFSAQIVCTTGVYEWYYTIGLRTAGQCIVAASFLCVLAALFLVAAVIHVGFVGASSVAWAQARYPPGLSVYLGWDQRPKLPGHSHAFTVAYLTKDFTAMSAIYLVRDANLTPGAAGNSLRARFVSGLLQYRSAILSHLSAITLFLGFHTLGLYVHNDVMQAFGPLSLRSRSHPSSVSGCK